VVLTGILLLRLEKSLYFLTGFALGDLDVVLGFAVITHQAKESIVGDIKLWTLSYDLCGSGRVRV
jgi:hypothetical protein